jgi:hypothetical protein
LRVNRLAAQGARVMGATTLIMLLAACGGGSSASPPVSTSPTTSTPTTTTPTTTTSVITTPTTPAISYSLTVTGAYGSGTYAAGQTVHVWSAVNPRSQVPQPWSGDAALLLEPAEWHSSFVMPARAVNLTPSQRELSFTLLASTYLGTTSTPKTVRYYFPPQIRGVVLMSHGTGGNSNFILDTEAAAVAQALVAKGYGVISTEAEEAVAGDLDKDGKLRWDTGFSASNLDLKNLDALFANWNTQGVLPSSVPKFALGMSNGGSFSLSLGALASTALAPAFPQLRFLAVASYCAQGQTSWFDSTTTPSAFYLCANDDNTEVKNMQALVNSQKLASRNVATDYREHPPSPLYDQRFARISGISLVTSRLIASELRGAGFTDAAGYLIRTSEEMATAVTTNKAAFPAINGLSTSLQRSVNEQLRIMLANHHMYDDYAQRNLAFFERFNPLP